MRALIMVVVRLTKQDRIAIIYKGKSTKRKFARDARIKHILTKIKQLLFCRSKNVKFLVFQFQFSVFKLIFQFFVSVVDFIVDGSHRFFELRQGFQVIKNRIGV